MRTASVRFMANRALIVSFHGTTTPGSQSSCRYVGLLQSNEIRRVSLIVNEVEALIIASAIFSM
jgi:hypothetical protein